MIKLDPETIDQIQTNLFPASQPAISDWQGFDWHKDKQGRPYTMLAQSSQALAIDLFGCLKVAEDRDLVMAALADGLDLPTDGPWEFELEWTDPDELLGEPRPTQVDAIAWSPRTVVLFECKFTEGPGSCSQPKPIRTGPHRGLVQCDGGYHLQTNPATGSEARCALTGKGIRYWDYAGALFGLDTETDHRPCPFRGEGYQWMRNLATCRALMEKRGVAGVVVAVYVDRTGLLMADKVRSEAWTRMVESIQTPPALRAMSYDQILAVAKTASPDTKRWRQLEVWMTNKIDQVCD